MGWYDETKKATYCTQNYLYFTSTPLLFDEDIFKEERGNNRTNELNVDIEDHLTKRESQIVFLRKE